MTWLYDQSVRYPILFLFYLAYVANEWLFRSIRAEAWLWQALKPQLFYIGGACKHSGHCCEKIMLFRGKTPLDSPDKFQKAVLEDPSVYTRFQPVSAAHRAYDCRCLTQDKRCSDYKNRPSFCRLYPANMFWEQDRLYEGCGYKILPKKMRFSIRSRGLSQRILTLCSHNKIELKTLSFTILLDDR